MPAIPSSEAIERLARTVEKASSEDLVEIYAVLYPEKSPPDVKSLMAESLAARVRQGIEPEVIVDLWNVVFPTDRSVWYNEQDGTLRYEERRLRYAES